MNLKNKNLDIRYLEDIDPTFEKNEVKRYAKDVFLKLQDAWTNDSDNDTWNDDIRQYMTDDLFNFYKKQLNRLKNCEQRNKIKIMSCFCKLLCYKELENYDLLAVSFSGKVLDYIENKRTRHLIVGSKSEFIPYKYTYLFIRPISAREEDSLNSMNCEYCGGPIDPENGNRCPYCQGINITYNSPNWILCRVEHEIPDEFLNVLPYSEEDDDSNNTVISTTYRMEGDYDE